MNVAKELACPYCGKVVGDVGSSCCGEVHGTDRIAIPPGSQLKRDADGKVFTVADYDDGISETANLMAADGERLVVGESELEAGFTQLDGEQAVVEVLAKIAAGSSRAHSLKGARYAAEAV